MVQNSVSSRSYFTRYVENVPFFKVRHGFFKNSFFPSTVEWNGTRLTKVSENQKVLISLKKAFQIYTATSKQSL